MFIDISHIQGFESESEVSLFHACQISAKRAFSYDLSTWVDKNDIALSGPYLSYSLTYCNRRWSETLVVTFFFHCMCRIKPLWWVQQPHGVHILATWDITRSSIFSVKVHFPCVVNSHGCKCEFIGRRNTFKRTTYWLPKVCFMCFNNKFSFFRIIWTCESLHYENNKH